MTALCIHRGASRVTRDELTSLVTPEATAGWTPVPHSRLVGLVENSLTTSGLEITGSDYAVWNDGVRFFGVLTLGGEHSDYSATVGIRNDHGRVFAAALALGSRVFVCDNLAFSSEVVISTRHTSRVLERLPGVISSGITKLVDQRNEQDRRIALYRETQISDARHLHDLVVRMYRAGAIPSTAIPRVLEEYESPKHEAFLAENLWSLMNATTEVLKTFGKLQPRTQRMHSVLDAEIASKLLAA